MQTLAAYVMFLLVMVAVGLTIIFGAVMGLEVDPSTPPLAPKHLRLSGYVSHSGFPPVVRRRLVWF